jgi:alpha-ribazole phosphatase
MEKNIYLVRHCKIAYGEEKSYIGSTDLPLCKEGINEAQKLKEYFSNIVIEKAYTSTLTRCLQTTEIILADRSIEQTPVEEFSEINLGEWEGKSFEYIKRIYPKQFEERGRNIDTFIPPGGESFCQLQNRVMPVVEKVIRSSASNILIVAHAGVNRVILSKLLDFPLKEVLNIKQPYGCVNELLWDKINQRWQCNCVIKEKAYDKFSL